MNDILINKEKVLLHLEQLNQLLFCYDVSLLENDDEKQFDEFENIIELMQKMINNYK